MRDSVLGDDEGCLERLRWYVYPKECALFLKEFGLDTCAKDNSRECLRGAVNPFLTTISDGAPTARTMEDAKSEPKAMMSESYDENVDKKRKMEIDDTPNGYSNSTSTSVVIPFRDGEHHQGEAELDEIHEGLVDGELSDKTEVFDDGLGEWVDAAKFISAFKKAKIWTVNQQTRLDQPPSTIQHKMKKAPRDESMWGKGEVAKFANADKKNDYAASNLYSADNDSNSQQQNIGKGKRTRHIKPPPKLMRLVTQAVFQWDMIQDGDRLLLGLSGGKDSLSLLHCLLELQRKLPTKFDIEVCTVDPMTPSFDPSPLIPYVEQTLGLKYYYIRDDIVARAASAGKDGSMVSSLCAFCARMKRGNLYNVARQNGCNKLVLAQHLDDCAESFLMSVMHNGFLRTMKANYEINAGDLSVIRPMVYCRESLMTEFAKQAKLPIVNENCPACFEEPKERARVKKLLSREELNYPNFYDNIKRSLLPLMHPHSDSVMHSFTEEAVAKSRKQWTPNNSSNKRPKTNEKSFGADVCSTVISEPDADTPDSDDVPSNSSNMNNNIDLSGFTDEHLMAELARRKAARFRLAGAMKSKTKSANKSDDAHTLGKVLCDTGGSCSLFD